MWFLFRKLTVVCIVLSLVLTLVIPVGAAPDKEQSPSVISASVSAEGDSVYLEFNKDMAATSVKHRQFSLKADDWEIAVNGASLDTNPKIIKLQLSERILYNQRAELSCSGDIKTAEGIIVPAFNIILVNNVPAKAYLYGSKWGSAGSGNGQFNNPAQLARDKSGNVYVVDSNNYRIQKFSSTGQFITKWGGFGSGNGQFRTPAGIAVSDSGRVYVSDSGNNRIQEFDANGKFISKWGQQGSGQDQLNNPTGLALGSNDTLFVCDTGNHRIQKFNTIGKHLSGWGGYGVLPAVWQVSSFVSTYPSDPNTDDSYKKRFNNPSGVVVKDGAVYVADTGNNRIMKYDEDGSFLSQYGFKYVYDRTENVGATQYLPAHTVKIYKRSFSLDSPRGVAIDKHGFIYFTGNNKANKLDSSFNAVTEWGSPEAATEGYGFENSYGIVIDDDGYAYIADYRGNCIKKYTPKGKYLAIEEAATNEDGDIITLTFNNRMRNITEISGLEVYCDNTSSSIEAIYNNTDRRKIDIKLNKPLLPEKPIKLIYNKAGTDPGKNIRSIFRSTDDQEINSIKDHIVENKITAPALIHSETDVDGKKVTLAFTQTMANPSGHNGQFGVMADGDSVAVVSVALNSDAKQIDLVLDTAVPAGRQITVSYSPGEVAAVNGKKLAAFSSQPVANRVPSPSLYVISAVMNFNSLPLGFFETRRCICLTFNRAMASPVEAEGQFSVIVDGYREVISNAVRESGRPEKVFLILDTAVENGSSVTVSYSQGSLTAADGGLLASFSNLPVVRDNPPAGPALIRSNINPAGNEIALNFDKGMADPAGKHGKFAVKADGNVIGVSSVELSSIASRINLKLDRPVTAGQAVTVSYAFGGIMAADGGVLPPFTDETVYGSLQPVAPVCTSAETNELGNIITLAFDKAMVNPAGKHEQFTVEVNGVIKPVASASLNSDSKKIDLQINENILQGDSVKVGYTPGTVAAANGAALAAFANKDVVNNIPAVPPVGPVSTEDETRMDENAGSEEQNAATDRLLLEVGTAPGYYFKGYFFEALNIGSEISETKTNKVILKREMTSNKKLAAWYNETANASGNVTKRTAMLTMYDKSGSQIGKWKLEGVWPSAVNYRTDEYDSDLYVETITLVCDKITRIE